MALCRHLVAMGMPERLAKAIGVESDYNISSGAVGTVLISKYVTIVNTQAAPNNRVMLPKMEESKTGIHIIYNGGGALADLVIDNSDGVILLPTTLAILANDESAMFIAAEDFSSGTKRWVGVSG